MLLIAGCGMPPDERAYHEVVATMSMQKAKAFFEQYPQSPYRGRLGDEIVEWCGGAGSNECYRLVLDALPRDHPRYAEVAARTGSLRGPAPSDGGGTR